MTCPRVVQNVQSRQGRSCFFYLSFFLFQSFFLFLFHTCIYLRILCRNQDRRFRIENKYFLGFKCISYISYFRFGQPGPENSVQYKSSLGFPFPLKVVFHILSPRSCKANSLLGTRSFPLIPRPRNPDAISEMQVGDFRFQSAKLFFLEHRTQ